MIATGVTLIGNAAEQTLTTIREIRALTPLQASEKRPVLIDAVVTYSDPSHATLFVQDSTGAIFVEGGGEKEYAPGLRVTLSGFTSAGSFTPVVTSPKLTPKSLAPLPPPRRVTHSELQSGSVDCEWVEIRGRIRTAISTNGILELLVALQDGRQVAWVRKRDGLNPELLVGALVNLRGVCAGARGKRNELLSFDLFINGREDLVLVEPAPRVIAETSIASIRALAANANHANVLPKRVRGRVTVSWPGETLFIEDATGNLQIKSRQDIKIARGDIIEATGFPNTAQRRSILEDSILTKVQSSTPPTPVPRTLKELYANASHGEFVILEGHLTDVALQPRLTRFGWLELSFQSAPTLVVESEGWFFHADLPPTISTSTLDHLERGSQVALTGVCIASDSDSDSPQVYRMLVESPEDIRLKHRPPWWTPKRFVKMLAGAGAVGLSILGWVAWFHARRRRDAEKVIQQRNEQVIRHQSALLELATFEGSAGMQNLRGTTEIAARTLKVARASVWLFDTEHVELTCLNLYVADPGNHETGAKLEVGEYPRYFAALEQSLTINASEARTDRRTSEFTEGYLVPLAIMSMLDVPIRMGGRVVGVLCLEQVGMVRQWTMEEQNFAAAVADHVSLCLEAEERAKAELALKEAHADLERRVFLRTSELADAKERAESADRVKSAFLATMSHELRTPLNSILGFTGIIHQGLVGPLNAEQKKQLGLVMNSARHLLSLINDVLDISKIEASQVELRLEPFDAPEAIRKAVGMVEPLAARKQLELQCQIDPNVGVVHNDRRRYEQILINLLNNAVKFTERGSVHVHCVVEDGFLHTEVVDTGIGIKPEHLGIIFKPFRQVDTGLTRQHEGTGLGLAICERLVTLLGGTIHVQSTWQQGSIFRFSLPVAPHRQP